MKNRNETRTSDRHFPLFPRMIATTFGIGYLPLCPGTWSAIFAVLIWLPLYFLATPWVTFLATAAGALFFSVAGVWASNVAERYWGKDPVVACVDETAGQLVALLPLASYSPWWLIIVSLALFRFFDIYKPLGIRSLERLPGGIGMMADDILSGIYAGIIVLAIQYAIILL